MKPLPHWIVTLSVGLALGLSASHATAQDAPNTPPQGQPGGQRAQGFRGMDFQNMSPAQIQETFRQRMLENYREQLEIKDDAEWQIIEARISKVLQARTEAAADGAGMMGMGNMFGGRGGRGGGGPGGGRGLQALFGQPSPESEALQRAIDANSPSAELKEKLAKLQEARKLKQATLVKAQEELRKVLSVRRESIAVLNGLLD